MAKKHTRLNHGSYEIRCKVKGVNYTGTGKTKAIALDNFIRSLNGTPRSTQKASPTVPKNVMFNVFAEKWLTDVKQYTVKAITYHSSWDLYNAHIKNNLKGKTVAQLTAMQLQPIFNQLLKEKKTKTANNVKLLLNQIFKAAISERIITDNPMDGIKVIKHHSQHGCALTYDEEREFIKALSADGGKYLLTFALMLYGGMRRAELATLRLEGGFVIVKDGKRRLSDIQTERKIPITPMLRRYIAGASKEDIRVAISYSCDLLSRKFKDFCPNHHLHELRHTFISRCQECGVAREVVSVWAGHAADTTMTTTVYTHFSEDFMLAEGQKVDYYNKVK
jgi:integrase